MGIIFQGELQWHQKADQIVKLIQYSNAQIKAEIVQKLRQ